MANLSVTYMGLQLKNPFIVGASNLVTDLRNLKKMEEAGAAAIVYKSLFEEQIQLEDLEMEQAMQEYAERNAEMLSLFPDLSHAGPAEYLVQLEKACQAVSIPVIASLNAVYDESWVEYAQKIQKAGAAALELNFYAVPVEFTKTAAEIEDLQIATLKAVKAAVKIPVSVKLSPYYTNILHLISRMDEAGASAFVLFNRLYQPDFDTEKEAQHFPYNLSHEEDNRLPLRYAGLLYGNVKASVCANSGIFTGMDAVKMILAGADCVQVVSTLYKNQIGVIAKMIAETEAWMDAKNYASLNDFRGKLSRKNSKDPYAYKRAQYVDILLKSDSIFNRYPMV
jgi:dihydroorotate dehydrogenase (fumarate)